MPSEERTSLIQVRKVVSLRIPMLAVSSTKLASSIPSPGGCGVNFEEEYLGKGDNHEPKIQNTKQN